MSGNYEFPTPFEAKERAIALNDFFYIKMEVLSSY